MGETRASFFMNTTQHECSQCCCSFCPCPLWEAGDLDLSPFYSIIYSSHLWGIAPVTRLETCMCTPKEDEWPAWSNVPWVSRGTMTWRLEYHCLSRSVYVSWTCENKTVLRAGTSADLWFSLLLQAEWTDQITMGFLVLKTTRCILHCLPCQSESVHSCFQGTRVSLWI